MEIVIRKALPDDALSLVELNYLFNEVRVSTEHISQSIASNTSEHVFVAQSRDKLIGFVNIVTHKSFCYEFLNAELTELFVVAEFRGKGVAKKLLDQVVKYSIGIGVAELFLRTKTTNKAANQLYKRLNFKLGNTNVYYAV